MMSKRIPLIMLMSIFLWNCEDPLEYSNKWFKEKQRDITELVKKQLKQLNIPILRKEVDDLKQQIQELQNTINTLQQTISQLEKDAESSESDLELLRQQIDGDIPLLHKHIK